MSDTSDRIKRYVQEAEPVWGRAYGRFGRVLEARHLRTGAEVGVAFGGHAESLLQTTSVERLYGIDPYQHLPNYDDPMNLPQIEFDELHRFTLSRLAPFGDRYRHLRIASQDAAGLIQEALDFVYLDADHTYSGVLADLSAWFPLVREHGVIGGHDYGHPNFAGVQQAVDEFFRRFDWQVQTEGEGVWWVEKRAISISFFIPAYNCATTIRESVESIVRTNLRPDDELIICNDASQDNTADVLRTLQSEYPHIQIVTHKFNKGGGAARNTAIEHTQHPLLFCLDSDNVLTDHSIEPLKQFLIYSGADVAAFEEVRYFRDNADNLTHRWAFRTDRVITFADYLSGHVIPGASGNYMFTRESWQRAGRYPEFAGALDTWGFGLWQAATGSKTRVLAGSGYLHRLHKNSYWLRDSKADGKPSMSLRQLQLLIPYINLIDKHDIDYILSQEKRNIWAEQLDSHPLRVKNMPLGSHGTILGAAQPERTVRSFFRRARNRILRQIGSRTAKTR